jgi:hypothetical protein
MAMSLRQQTEKVFRALSAWIQGSPYEIVRFAGLPMLTGFLLAFVSARYHVGGVITGLFLISLGACGGTLTEWRTERGLWMLAGLFLVMNCTIYCLFAYGQMRDWVRGAPAAGLGTTIDFVLGTTLLTTNIRFLAKVTQQNLELSRQSGDV